ncbi:hypothetical protein R1sor_025340 [Riccia sorocarpa]|uniref:Uncharacterized protein n=1 Tax=Riccia sorocarpa TaxID=122646 RepID=A0ABD3G8C5_9MARC
MEEPNAEDDCKMSQLRNGIHFTYTLRLNEMVNAAVATRFFLLDRLEDDMFKRLAFFLAGRPHDVYTKTAVQGMDHLYLFINFKAFTSRKDLKRLNLNFTSASDETFSTVFARENTRRRPSQDECTLTVTGH